MSWTYLLTPLPNLVRFLQILRQTPDPLPHRRSSSAACVLESKTLLSLPVGGRQQRGSTRYTPGQMLAYGRLKHHADLFG